MSWDETKNLLKTSFSDIPFHCVRLIQMINVGKFKFLNNSLYPKLCLHSSICTHRKRMQEMSAP